MKGAEEEAMPLLRGVAQAALQAAQEDKDAMTVSPTTAKRAAGWTTTLGWAG